MSEDTSHPLERELLDALDAALAAPAALESAQTLSEALQKLPTGHVYSAVAAARLRALAARRAETHRAHHQVLIGALQGSDDAEAIAFMLDILPDDGLSSGAVDALDRIDPARVAAPFRAWLAGRDLDALPNALMVRALYAKLDLAAPPADRSPAPVTEELLEYWVQRNDLPALRLALAHGASANASISHGETLLHFAVDAWTSAPEDDGSYFERTRPEWETFIGELLAAGADPERKLTGRFSGSGERRWSKGTTPRAMLGAERERGQLSEEEIDRLEARFPASAKAPKARKASAAKAKKATPPARDVSFRRPIDEALAGLRGTALGPAFDEALATWTDEVLASQPHGPWGYATSLIQEIGEAAPEVAAKMPGWMGVLMTPAAQRVHKMVLIGSRQEERLFRDMTLATMERDMERFSLDGWNEDAAALVKKETRLAYRDGAFLLGKKKGDTTVLWEASREGVVDLGTVQSFVTAQVKAARKALAKG